MTAIFAVWNRNGLAVAADTNVSIVISDGESERTMWTDSTSKVQRISGHGVVVASAQSTNINGIPVMSVVDRWAETLTMPLDAISDYVSHFFHWLSAHPLPADVSSGNIESRVHRILNTLTDDAEPDQMPSSDQVANAINTWGSEEPENLFIPWDSSSIQEILDGELDDAERHKFSVIAAAHPSVSMDQAEAERLRLQTSLEEILTERFEIDDSDEEEFTDVCDLLADYLMTYWDDESSETDVLFIGYGTKEWIPSSVSIRIASYGGELPRAVFTDATNANLVYFQALAQDEQMRTLLRGISPVFSEKLSAHVGEHGETEVLNLLDELVTDRIDTIQRKIDHLTLERLAFLARSFVEVERLASFLMEDLPGVGGEIEVETLSR